MIQEINVLQKINAVTADEEGRIDGLREVTIVGDGLNITTKVYSAHYYRVAPASDQLSLNIGYWAGAWAYGHPGISVTFDNKVGINNLLPLRPLDVGGIARGEIEDKGGQVFNVKAYGAKGDGSTDDTPAIQTAINALPANGGVVFFPHGTFRITDAGLITGGFVRGRRFVGAGPDATTLLLASTAIAGITFGSTTNDGGWCAFSSVENMTITREEGPIPTGAKGLWIATPSYVLLKNVRITRHDKGIHLGNQYVTSLGVDMDRVIIHDCIHHCHVQNVAEVHMDFGQFGLNGGETIAPVDLLTLEGTSNDIRLKTVQFVPRILPNTTVAIKFVGMTVGNPGYFRFEDINTENVATVFASDSTCGYIGEMFLVNSRITATGKLWDWYAGTALSNHQFLGNAISFVTESVVSGAKFSRFQGNSVSGVLTFNGGEWSVVGNTLTSTSNYSGVFTALDLSHNKLVFNASAPISLNVTGSGPITKIGNTADVGAQPNNLLPGGLNVAGAFSAGSKSFVIDHPLDPSNKELKHSTIEGAGNGLHYWGEVNLVGGRATVDIDAEWRMTPGTFEALAQRARVMKPNNISGFTDVRATRITGGTFEIIAADSACTDTVTWQVLAERHDPFLANNDEAWTDGDCRLIPERNKHNSY